MSERACPAPHGDMYFPTTIPAGYGLALAQWCFAVMAIIGLIAAPPASGRILLVPIGGEGRDGLARLAIDAGARLVAPGPWAGSLVVSGDRAPLIAALLPRHALVLSASLGGCGEGEGRS
ncbi:MAG: hypothetical protein ABW169_03225 [Sphingobium sp.]